MAYARTGGMATLVAVLVATITGAVVPGSRAQAQDVGFGLGDAYRYYADPGNGGGSAYAPFFDPYRGNRIVRGAYPDAAYDGHGYHYGKSVPPSLYVNPYAYDQDLSGSRETYDRGDRYGLLDGETMTTPITLPRGGQRSRSATRHRRRSPRLRVARDH